VFLTGRSSAAILIHVRLRYTRQLAAITGNELDVDQQHDITQRHLIRIIPLAVGIAHTTDTATGRSNADGAVRPNPTGLTALARSRVVITERGLAAPTPERRPATYTAPLRILVIMLVVSVAPTETTGTEAATETTCRMDRFEVG